MARTTKIYCIEFKGRRITGKSFKSLFEKLFLKGFCEADGITWFDVVDQNDDDSFVCTVRYDTLGDVWEKKVIKEVDRPVLWARPEIVTLKKQVRKVIIPETVLPGGTVIPEHEAEVVVPEHEAEAEGVVQAYRKETQCIWVRIPSTKGLRSQLKV